MPDDKPNLTPIDGDKTNAGILLDKTLRHDGRITSPVLQHGTIYRKDYPRKPEPPEAA